MTPSQLHSRLLVVLSLGGCTVSQVRDLDTEPEPARSVLPAPVVDEVPVVPSLSPEPPAARAPDAPVVEVVEGPHILGDLVVVVAGDGPVTLLVSRYPGSSEVLGLPTDLDSPMVLGQVQPDPEATLRAPLELELEPGETVYIQAVSEAGASEVQAVQATWFPSMCGKAPMHELADRMTVCDAEALPGLCPSIDDAVLDAALIQAVGPVPQGTTVTATCFEERATASCCYSVDVVEPLAPVPLDTGFIWDLGRPFRVAGERRQSEVGERPSIADPVAERVASVWIRMAREEHASVAAFARFSLELMQLGAPMDLLAASCRAQAEELAHTELTLAMASRMAGQPIELGSLPMDGALDGRDLATVTMDVVREGCINETVSTLLAMDQRDHASDPMARAALTRIADDEAGHAELAWRFVRWALDQDPSLRPAVLAELRSFAPEITAEPSPDAAALAAFGVLDRRGVQAAAVRASRVIAACAATLS